MKEVKLRAFSEFNGQKKMLYSDVPKENYKITPFGVFTIDKHNYQHTSYILFGQDYPIMECADKFDNFGVEIYGGDIVEIDRDSDKLRGEVKQLDGGQSYIDHPKVSLKYAHQIHCEVCETESLVFFLDFFDSYELEVIGNVYEHPNLIEQ